MVENNIGGDAPQVASSSGQQKHADRVITIVLTADNHLGYVAFSHHPRKREERLQRLRHAFQQATDFAVGQGVDLFIQAGDLFDIAVPEERDRTFVAARLAQLRQAGIRTFTVGGVHDTPVDTHSLLGEGTPAPQLSYAQLDALHYFAPGDQQLEPVFVDIRGVRVGICGLGVQAGQEGDPLASVRVKIDIESATIPLLVLHAPIEGLNGGSSLLDTRAQVMSQSIEQQTSFGYILAGYHHAYTRQRIGTTDIIVAGATQHTDFSNPDGKPGFVFIGLDAGGVRWCNHIPVDALNLRRLVLNTADLWAQQTSVSEHTITDSILERLQPLCSETTMVQLVFEGELSRSQYHQLDLKRIRRYGEEHCFTLAIDDSKLVLLPEQEAVSAETGERFSPREELIALADEWIAAAQDEAEKKALQATKEELLVAMDEVISK